MILVFGGTTEGKQVIQLLNSLCIPFIYTTKTKINADVKPYGKYIHGVLNTNKLKELVTTNPIQLIINASHPFAEVLHQTIAIIATECSVPVYRLERNYPLREKVKNVLYVSNYKELENVLTQKHKGQKGLFLTGVQTIERLSFFWKERTSYFRILDRETSKNIALKSNFPSSNLILGMPNKAVTAEVELIKKLGVNFVVTKESGESGLLSVKIKAAQQCETPIIIIEKPKLPNVFKVYNTIDELALAVKLI